MPGILDQKFQHNFQLPSSNWNLVKQYCEQNIGYRTYWLSARIGGKQWYMNRPNGNHFNMGVDDSAHAVLLVLQYAGDIK